VAGCQRAAALYGERTGRAGAVESPATLHGRVPDRAVHLQRALIDRPAVRAGAGERPGRGVDLVEGREALILRGRAAIAQVETGAAGAAELEDIRAGAEHVAVDHGVGSERQRVSDGAGGEIDGGGRGSASADGAVVEHAGRGVARAEGDSGQ